MKEIGGDKPPAFVILRPGFGCMKWFKNIAGILLAVGLTGCAGAGSHRVNPPPQWYKVYPGMTREQVHALIGPPQSVQPDQPTETWQGPGDWKFDVTYDFNGRVHSTRDEQRK